MTSSTSESISNLIFFVNRRRGHTIRTDLIKCSIVTCSSADVPEAENHMSNFDNCV